LAGPSRAIPSRAISTHKFHQHPQPRCRGVQYGLRAVLPNSSTPSLRMAGFEDDDSLPDVAPRFALPPAQSRPRDLSSVATPSTLARPQCRPRKRGTLHGGHAWRRRKRGTLHKRNVGEVGSTKRLVRHIGPVRPRYWTVDHCLEAPTIPSDAPPSSYRART